jgi:hypothetical protein
MLRAATILLGGALTAAVLGVAPAHADPGPPSCDLEMALLCRMLPIAPDLDHDIDLTVDQPQPAVDPAAPEQDSLPPVPICSAGCH